MLKDLAHHLKARLIVEVVGEDWFFIWPEEWHGESEQEWSVSVRAHPRKSWLSTGDGDLGWKPSVKTKWGELIRPIWDWDSGRMSHAPKMSMARRERQKWPMWRHCFDWFSPKNMPVMCFYLPSLNGLYSFCWNVKSSVTSERGVARVGGREGEVDLWHLERKDIE